MPNDRVSEHLHRGRLDRARDSPREGRSPAPVYLGQTTATRAVQKAIHAALQTKGHVLVSGAPGTGKRTVAEILHHFSDAVGPLEQPEIAGRRIGRIGRIGRISDLAYVCPIEALSLRQQAGLLDAAGSTRLVLGTRLELDSPDADKRLHRRLVLACPNQIQLPTLRSRIDDLELLASKILCESPSRRPIGGIDDDAFDCLRAHPWSGNVTELEEVLRAAIEVGTGEQIELRDLPPGLRLRAVESLDLGLPDHEFSLAHAERSAIERAMRYARSNKRKAARLLQISKTTLYRKLRQYHVCDDVDVPDHELRDDA